MRFNLWDDLNELRSVVNEFVEFANVIKIGRDELEFITGLKEEAAVNKILENENLKILLLTDGAEGAKLYVNGKCFSCKGYSVKTVDTTGAGDSFFGAFLALLLKNKIDKEKLIDDKNNYQQMLEFACKAGAYTTTGYGAIQAMGDLESIERTVK